jgi:protein-S-isoprenylcysteine O-methyltransferase Ste14
MRVCPAHIYSDQFYGSKGSALEISYFYLRFVMILLGLAAIALGCIVNIKGRMNLGGNWANQIRIYKDQTLVTHGVYKIVRHPLYASLIWMFYGACLVYQNGAAFAANTLIFIPFMYYRAKQEEAMLCKRFINYETYRQKTGMFFPKRRQANASK